MYEAARNLNETVEPPLPPPRYQHSPRGRHPGSRQTAYAASGPPPSRSRGYPAKRPKYNEPPPLPVTAAEAQAFLDAWIQDGKVSLPEARKEPTQRDMEHPDYCIYHRMVRHPTKDCWGLRTLSEKFRVEEAMELTATKDVLRIPLPNHKDNGKAVMMVTISHHEENEEPASCEIANIEGPEYPNFEERRASSLQNSTKFKRLFDQFGFSQATRFEATKAILRSPSTSNPNEKKQARDAILAKARAPAEVDVGPKVVKYTRPDAEIFPEEEIEDWRTPISNELKSAFAATTLSNLRHFTIYQGVLYYKGSGGLLARCIGEEEAKVKIREVHERSCGTRDVSLYRRLQRQGLRQFAEGDLVLKATPHVMKGKSASKFAAKWEGPFVVKEANENGYYRLSELDSEVLLAPINAKWLKAYHP
ncbi:hypothetical protein RHMOL_Rhmol06G0135900 [Rhododendron molle]|uniref:Uncharacterized protein n=1 Tax=Rhododendron molle TaxID=49168 RepID=A0ACC0NBU8_RHOML|nr:hypothetical protein RHMOL_Rhmol06G0135900 [Rhododendron molle]